MLLKGWTTVITRAECRPEAQTVHCCADGLIPTGAAVHGLDAVLGGYIDCKKLPSVTLLAQFRFDW